MGKIGFIIGLSLTILMIYLLIYGFYSLWNALIPYEILGIVVFLIFFVVVLPVTIILFVLALLPMIIGAEI